MVGLGDRGRRLLLEHGYDVGEGFVDNLSQYASLEAAERQGRLRDPGSMITRLNESAR